MVKVEFLFLNVGEAYFMIWYLIDTTRKKNYTRNDTGDEFSIFGWKIIMIIYMQIQQRLQFHALDQSWMKYI